MTDARPDQTPDRELPAFAHASEAEMARILEGVKLPPAKQRIRALDAGSIK